MALDERRQLIRAELARAGQLLRSLEDEAVHTITVNSLEAQDAPFLGLIVSKLSPIIGNLLERRVVQLLSHADTGHGWRWVRQDPGFPDAALVAPDGPTGAGYEIKAWYALSTEITGRFRESQRLLAGRDVQLAVIAWRMSHVVYGTPFIVDVLTTDALGVARARDHHYYDPPNYLTVEPEDTTQRTANLRQTNVSGYRIQTRDLGTIATAETLVGQRRGRRLDPSSAEAQALVRELLNTYAYRLDTNFAKIDRLDHESIETFKEQVLSRPVRDRTLRQWARLLADLSSTDTRTQEAAAAVIRNVYAEL